LIPFVTSVDIITHQACPTLPPSCSSSGQQNQNRGGQVAIVNFDGDVLLNQYVRPDEPRSYWRTSREFLYLNGTSPAQMRSNVNEIIRGRIIVGFSIFHDLQGLQIDYPLSMLRDVSLFLKYKVQNGTLSLAAAVQMDLNRTIQTQKYHDALEDASATMDLFRLNHNFENETIPTKDYAKYWLSKTSATSEPTLAPCPTVPPVCLPPPEDLVAINCMIIRVGKGRKKAALPIQVTLVDYWHETILNEYILQNITDFQTNFTGITQDVYDANARNFTYVQELVINKTESKIIIGYSVSDALKILSMNHENEKLRELQRSPPI
ncbi:6786_t:CDS:2, partial [Gigaspora rosea]